MGLLEGEVYGVLPEKLGDFCCGWMLDLWIMDHMKKKAWEKKKLILHQYKKSIKYLSGLQWC